jgi:hypothetical protein
VTSFGGVFQASHLFMLDVPMAAMMALALEALFASNRFASARRSLLLGFLCGLGMLAKWMFLFYIAVPFTAETLAAARLPDRFRRWRNASMCVAVGALITLSWYLFHAPNLLQESVAFGFHWEGSAPVLSVLGLTFYARALPTLLLLPWLAALLVVGIPALVRNAALRRFTLLSLSGLLLLTFLRSKNERYAIAALPAIAVLATSVTEERWRPRTRFAAAFMVALASIGWAVRQDPPVHEYWPIAETLDAALASPPSARPCVRVIPDIPAFQRFAFEYAAEAQRRSVDVEGGSGFPTFTDAVILKTGDQGQRPEANEIMAAITRDDGGFHETFRKAWERALPDGSRVEVYRRDVRPIPGISVPDLVERLRTAIQAEVERQIHAPFRGRIEIESYSDEDTLRGHFRRLTISGRDQPVAERGADGSGLRVREVGCELDGVTVNPFRLARDGELEVLSLEALTPHLRLRQQDVQSWLHEQKSGPELHVSFQGGLVQLQLARARMPSFTLVFKPEIVEGQNIGFRPETLRAAAVKLPRVFLAALLVAYNPILKEMPCRIHIVQLRCDGGELAINEPEATESQGLQSDANLQRKR